VKARTVISFCLLWLFPVPAKAQLGKAKDTRTFTFYFENDTFFGTDSLYINGVKLSFISSDLTDYRNNAAIPKWSYPLIERLPFVNEPGFQRSLSLSIGQNMYTPEDTDSSDLVKDDRQYAGVAFISIGLNSKSERRMDTLELGFGIVGPHSYAEDTQRIVHEWKGIDVPQGWDHQLKDEPILNVFVERRWKFAQADGVDGLGYDVIPNMGAGLGNALLNAHIGTQVRFGWNLPNDFGTNLIRPGSDTNAPIDETDPRFFSPHHRFGVHVLAGADGQLVLRNITLDGNTFRQSHSVDKEPLVASLMAGVGIIIYRFKITFAHVFKTKEFKTQRDEEEYGSITISYAF